MFVITELYAFDQPFGEPLLRDEFTLVLSAVGNKELGSALLPDIAGSPQVHVQMYSFRVCLTQSAKRPIHLIVHRWHKDRTGRVCLGGYLGEEAQPGEQHHTSIGKPDIRGLTAQHVHVGRSASW